MKKANSFQGIVTQIIVKIKENKKQVWIIVTLAVLLTTSIIVLVKGDQDLSASVTNLGGYGYGQTNTGATTKKPDGYGYGQTGASVDCKSAAISLACAININCPAQCKPDTKKPDGFGYGKWTTGPVINTVPLCKRAETVLACALGTRNCPEECKAPTKNDPKPRIIFPPKRK